MKSAKSLFLGILAAAGALVLELVILFFIPKEIELTFSKEAIIFLACLALIEELMKFLAIYESSQELNSLKSAIKNAFFIGLGFSTSELILKTFTFNEDVFLENSAAFIFHILSSILIGLFLFKKKEPSLFYRAIIIFVAVFIHLLFNLFMISLFQ